MRFAAEAVTTLATLCAPSCSLLPSAPSSPQDSFGSQIFPILDLDGDGVEEFVVADGSSYVHRWPVPEHLWVLSGRTLECLGRHDVLGVRGSSGLVGTHAQGCGGVSPDRILVTDWHEGSRAFRVLDARTCRTLGAFELRLAAPIRSITTADVDADGTRDLLLTIQGMSEDPLARDIVHSIDGQTFQVSVIEAREPPKARWRTQHGQYPPTVAEIGDRDGDGIDELLVGAVPLGDASFGSLRIVHSSDGHAEELPLQSEGLGRAIAVARDVRTRQPVSVAVAACHPEWPCFPGRVLLLRTDTLQPSVIAWQNVDCGVDVRPINGTQLGQRVTIPLQP